MDFQKAFEKVPHNRLLTKLKGYGLSGQMHVCIEAFLSERTQRVNVRGSLSDPSPVSSGIPQGSVLGPILFIIFINDLPDIVYNTVYLFADDTKLFGLANSPEDTSTLQNDLDLLHNWSKTWLLDFHPDKCKILRLGNRNNKPLQQYTLNNTILEDTSCEKDLGVWIDSKLNFNMHIDEKVKKANCIMGIIRRSFRYLNCTTFSQLFKSMVRPHLEYAAPVWNPSHKKNIRN